MAEESSPTSTAAGATKCFRFIYLKRTNLKVCRILGQRMSFEPSMRGTHPAPGRWWFNGAAGRCRAMPALFQENDA